MKSYSEFMTEANNLRRAVKGVAKVGKWTLKQANKSKPVKDIKNYAGNFIGKTILGAITGGLLGESTK